MNINNDFILVKDVFFPKSDFSTSILIACLIEPLVRGNLYEAKKTYKLLSKPNKDNINNLFLVDKNLFIIVILLVNDQITLNEFKSYFVASVD
jgi:hypothetical protein